nr:uncharacterized mitochondrial protein AtMg00810-like [Tanacetum cinerariifolium]
MKDNFEMSMMGEMNFFLGLHVHQSPRGIFINTSQYTLKLLKKHGMDGCNFISTPMATTRIDTDLQGLYSYVNYGSKVRIFVYMLRTSHFDEDATARLWISLHQDSNVLRIKERSCHILTVYQLGDLFTKPLPKERFEYFVHKIVIIMEQPEQITPDDPLECKIVGKLLVDHALSYALTTTIDVLAMYLQQLWKTINQVPNENETIRFMVHKEEITYTVDMFCATFKLLVETPEQPFIAPASLKIIQPFLKIFGYQELVDKYPHFTKLIVADVMSKFEFVPKRLEEEYHAIKDDTSLVSVYTTGKTFLQFNHTYLNLPKERKGKPSATRTPNPTDVVQKTRKRKQVAGESSLPRKSLKITIKKQKPISTVPPPPINDQEHDDIHEATLLSLVLHKTAKITEEQENMAAFADSVFLDEEDSGTRLEPESHKENPKIDDDDIDKKDDKNGDDDDDDDDENDDHALLRTRMGGHKYKHIPGALYRICKRQGFMIKLIEKKYVTNREFQGIKERVDDVLHDIVPKIASNATIDLIKDNLLKIIATVIWTDIQEQVADLELWDVLKPGNRKLPDQDQFNHTNIDIPCKEEKRVMDLVEIVKFCDATLEKVLKEVKLKIFETEFMKKAQLLGDLDLKIMKTYETKIMKCAKHREQMRRWESFMHGRPILPTMRRQ